MKHLIQLRLFIIVACLLLFVSACASSDDSSSDSSNTICLRLAIDGADDIYISGYTSEDLNNDSNIGESDIFLIKYGSDGVQDWSTLLGTTDDDYMQGLTVTAGNEALIAGYTYSTLDGNTSSGGSDMALIQVGSDGVVSWRKQFGTSSDDFAYSVTLDSSGNILIGGHTYGSFPGSGTTISGTKDLVVVKLDSSGNQIWATQVSNDEDDSYTAIYGVYGVDIKVDGSDNVYVAGFATGDLPGNSNTGSYDLFVAKFDSAGTRQWITQWGSDEEDYTKGLQVTNAGDVYVTGYTVDVLDGQTSSGYTDIFLVKLDTSGTIQWIKQTGTDASESANGIALDSSENILITGYTNGDLEDDNEGGSDLILLKYDSSGNQIWTEQDGSDSTDVARAIAIDSTDKIYLTGYTYGELHDESNSDDDYYSFISQYGSTGSEVWTVLF